MTERMKVEVAVNHGQRRRGERFDTFVTPQVVGLLERGYLLPAGPADGGVVVDEVEVVIIKPGEPPKPAPVHTPPSPPVVLPKVGRRRASRGPTPAE